MEMLVGSKEVPPREEKEGTPIGEPAPEESEEEVMGGEMESKEDMEVATTVSGDSVKKLAQKTAGAGD